MSPSFFLALDIGFLFLAMDRGRPALDAADHASVELAMTDLFDNAAALHFAGEGIQKATVPTPLLFCVLRIAIGESISLGRILDFARLFLPFLLFPQPASLMAPLPAIHS